MNITKVLPDFYTTDLDCLRIKNYLASVLQTTLGLPNYQSNLNTRSVEDGVKFSFYLPMINNSIKGFINKKGSIVVDKLDNNIIVATFRTGMKSYLIKDGKFVESRESGDIFIKYNEKTFLITSYGNPVYSPDLNAKVITMVDCDGVPYNSLRDAFVMVQLSGTPEFYEGLNGVKYLNYTFNETDLPEYTKNTNSWLGELFQ